MSPKIPSLATAGLLVLGLFEGSSRSLARPFDPPGTPPSAASTATQAPAESSVLLLSSGQIFEGEILEDTNGYSLKHRIGVMRFARRNVVGVFRSVEEVYQYKVGRMPKNDPDERLKLAIWCLGQKLDGPAREQLEATLALNPENKQAKAMLFHLNSGGMASASADAAVTRTSLELADNAASAAPRELPRRALDEIYDASHRQPVGPPVILDLPQSQAARRYMEFGKYVHIELQNHCARCHDADTYKGDFRLVHARNRRDLQNDLLVRTNLDATLRLINPLDLAHSELLTVSALTHPPDGRPVLGGPNNPSYRVFQTWVANLNDRGDSSLAAKPDPARSAAPRGPAFGAGRMSATAGQTPAPSRSDFYTPPVASAPRYPAQAQAQIPPSGPVAPGVPAQVNFPTPVSPGNFPPPGQFRPVPGPVPLPAASALRQVPPGAGLASGAQPKNGDVVVLDDGSKAIYLNGQCIPYVAEEDRGKARSSALNPAPGAPRELPAMPAPAAPNPAAPARTPAKKTRPKLDPAALQKFMSGGQGN